MKEWTPSWKKTKKANSSKSSSYLTWLLSGIWFLTGSLVIAVLVIVLLYRWVNPHPTWLMAQRYFIHESTQLKPVEHCWAPIHSISDYMILAVIASEDNLFLSHKGFDYEAIKQAQEERRKGTRIRGASTISMQTAKNVFLWPKRSWTRKALEAGFTWLIEMVWGKKRIMEVYLNIIEVGQTVYGVQAASINFFGCHAAELSKNQAALIATVLPNPLQRDLAEPSSFMRRHQQRILRNMRNIGPIPPNTFKPTKE